MNLICQISLPISVRSASKKVNSLLISFAISYSPLSDLILLSIAHNAMSKTVSLP